MSNTAFDRKAHWEAVYTDRSPGEVSWYQAEPTLSLEQVRRAGIPLDAPLIDVGGGASVLVDRLCAAGYRRVAVLDVSDRALEHARQRMGAMAEAVEWYAADITAFTPPHGFALWHDRAVFHFLTDAGDRERYLKTLNRALDPGGHVIIAAFAMGGPTRCSGLDIVQYDAGSLARTLGPAYTLLETQPEMHTTPGGATQQFGYHRFVREGT